MKKKCDKCGRKNDADAKFCNYCGNGLNSVTCDDGFKTPFIIFVVICVFLLGLTGKNIYDGLNNGHLSDIADLNTYKESVNDSVEPNYLFYINFPVDYKISPPDGYYVDEYGELYTWIDDLPYCIYWETYMTIDDNFSIENYFDTDEFDICKQIDLKGFDDAYYEYVENEEDEPNSLSGIIMVHGNVISIVYFDHMYYDAVIETLNSIQFE